MKRKYIDCKEYANVITKALNPGILLTTKAGGKVNTMTIGWGSIGVNWSRPVFIAYVRQSRYTHQMIDANPFFTVNVPYGEYDKAVLGFCGTKSGRDTDKISECSLTAVESEKINVPALKEFPLTLECRVIYREDEKPELMDSEIRDKLYTPSEDGTRDIHTVYYGEIVSAYILEEE
ncbi:MAG: flavin reductase family protein [Solobacterium sp.]|nr:flavin reductase family protein [Solobacterium sp.]